jgi:carbonic anhydrase
LSVDSEALLVIGARIVAGAEHEELERTFRDTLPADSTAPGLPIAGFQLASVLPDLLGSWRYGGSLTAPSNVGCDNPAGSVAEQLRTDIFRQNVHWIVVPEELQLLRRQIVKFQTLFDFGGNARPTQPLNDRTVYRDRQEARQYQTWPPTPAAPAAHSSTRGCPCTRRHRFTTP